MVKENMNVYGLERIEDFGVWWPVKGYVVTLKRGKFIVVDDEGKEVWRFTKEQEKYVRNLIADYGPFSANVFVSDSVAKIVLLDSPLDELYFWKGGNVTGTLVRWLKG